MSHANFGHSAQPQPTLSPRSIDQRIRAIQGSLLSAASAESRKKGCESGVDGDDSAESADVGNRRAFENTSWQQEGGGQSRESFRKTTNTKGLTLNIDSCIKGQLRRLSGGSVKDKSPRARYIKSPEKIETSFSMSTIEE